MNDQLQHESEEPTQEEDTDIITSVSVFGDLMVAWHTMVMNNLVHMKRMPIDPPLIITVDDEERVMEGDLYEGFQLGLGYALSVVHKLPFCSNEEEDVEDVTEVEASAVLDAMNARSPHH